MKRPSSRLRSFVWRKPMVHAAPCTISTIRNTAHAGTPSRLRRAVSHSPLLPAGVRASDRRQQLQPATGAGGASLARTGASTGGDERAHTFGSYTLSAHLCGLEPL